MLTNLTALLAGAILGLLLERVRWRREDRLRWVPERRAVYSQFLSAVDEWEVLDHEAALIGETEEWYDAPAADRLDPLLGTQTSTRLRPRVNAAWGRVGGLVTEINLVGSSLVYARAESLVARMQLLSAVRFSSPPRPCGGCSEELSEAQAAYQERREQFVAAVRSELGAG